MHTGFTVAACRGCSRGTARHSSPQARHGFPGTAALRQPLVQLYAPRARKPPRRAACTAVLAAVCLLGFLGTFPPRDPLIPKYSKKWSTPAAFNVVFPRAKPRAVSSHGGSPKSSSGSSARAAQPRKGIWKKQEEMKSSW